MTRRDTIIVAVLINTGLLLILFVTAVNSSNEQSRANYSPVISSSRIESVNISAQTTQAQPQKDLGSSSFESRADEVEESLAQASQTPEKGQEYVEVLVKKGDNLAQIAKEHQVVVSEIVKLNSLPSTTLMVGQLLRVPVKKTSSPAIKAAPEQVLAQESKSEEEGVFYTIKSGDNLWLISMRNGIDLDRLLKINNLDEKKAKRLHPGDKIRIR